MVNWGSMAKYLLAFVLILLPCAAPALDPDKLDRATLEALTSGGELVLVEEDDFGNIDWVTAAIRIDSSPARVWAVISNPDDFEKFLPNTEEVRVLKREGSKGIVNFKMKIKFSILSVRVDSTNEFEYDEDRLKYSWNYLRGDLEGSKGVWQLLSTPDGKGTLAFYKIHSDLRTLGFGVRMLLQTHPEVESGVLTVTGIKFVRALKERMEHPERFSSEGAQAFE